MHNITRGKKMKKGLCKKQYIYYLLTCISLAIILYAGMQMVLWKKDQLHIQKLKSELEDAKQEETLSKESILINPPNDPNDVYWSYVDIPFLQVDFTDLLEQNSDTVGWIQIPNTNVDYPIVQTKDNNYYLTHAFDQSYNKAGWIFSDFRNNLSHMNPNTVIYGHGRYDNSMFGSLRFLLEDSWYQDINNHIIKISTPKENMIFEIFSVYTIPVENYYITTHFKDDNTFQSFLNIMVSRSLFSFSTTVNTKDKILTLSTCQNDNGIRVVVHAKIIKKETRS